MPPPVIRPSVRGVRERRRLGAAARFRAARFGWIQPKGLSSSPMKRAILVILLGTLLAAAAAQATTYMRVEKDGSKTYSDRPLPGGQEVVIESAQTYSAPPAPTPTDPSRSPEQQQVLDAANFRY